ncbi:MAG TPA: four-helix bundle copper-binding protein [Prolixibacteraceae bacterium]|jgi:hypothetical protein
MANQKFKESIQACDFCAIACSHCATECLMEQDVKMLYRCIQLDLECAVVCRSASELMSLGSEYSVEMCRVCAEVCNSCAEECEKHAKMGMEHCRECADACRECADACMQMVAMA